MFKESQLAQNKDTKYLFLHLDRRLKWKKLIFTKRNQLRIKFRDMYRMMGRNSRLSINDR